MQQLVLQRSGGLDEMIARIRPAFREARREVLEEAADAMRQALDSSIVASGLHDDFGKIRGWQMRYDGSGGGYTALRAVAGESGPDSPGAITNYLESGHRVRFPSGRSKRYRPEVHVARAKAFRFYRRTDAALRQLETAAAQSLERRIAEKLEE